MPAPGEYRCSAAQLATLPFILYPKDPHSPFDQKILALLRNAEGQPGGGL